MSHRSSLAVALTTPTLLMLLTTCQVSPADQAEMVPETTSAPAVEYLTTPETESMGFPFSDAVRVGNMLYLSGHAGNLPGATAVVEGGIQAETRQTMENIKATLERYGSSMDRIVKCTVMIDDIADWPAMNEVYATYFPGHKPARSAFGAEGLPLDAAVEIECWATVG